jgi:predicted phage terminase large subunit-like protein
LGGGLVKTEWFERYRDSDKPERFDRIVQSWDTANKATELSDYSVCTTWGVNGKHLFLIGLFRRRLEYPALKRAVREQQNLFNACVVLIEDKASGTQLIQDLIAEGCHGVTRYQPTDEKTMRMHAQTGVVENGFVHLPETAPWLAEYLHELAVFPNGKHDDQADSTAQFLDWFKRPFPGQNMYELYQRDFERGRRRTRSWVRLQAPPGIGSVQTSRADTSMSVLMARSKCRPRTPNSISETAGPNSQNGRPSKTPLRSAASHIPCLSPARWSGSRRRRRRAEPSGIRLAASPIPPQCPECCANPRLCRGTGSSNPSPSSMESAANLLPFIPQRPQLSTPPHLAIHPSDLPSRSHCTVARCRCCGMTHREPRLSMRA